MVFEEDFRFAPQHPDIKGSVGLDMRMRRFREDDTRHNSTRQWEEGNRTNLHIVPARSSTEEFRESKNEFLNDICRYLTRAHEVRMGDVVWFGWNCGQPGEPVKSDTRMSFGSQFICYSVQGARIIKGALTCGQVPQGHWDLSLRHFLQSGKTCIEYAFFWPPMGCFTSHASGCDPKKHGELRLGSEKESWVCFGTRQAHDVKRREKWLCHLYKKHSMNWKHEVTDVVDQPQYLWKTFCPLEYRETVSFGFLRNPEWWNEPPPFNVFESASGDELLALTDEQDRERNPKKYLYELTERKQKATKVQMKKRGFRIFVQNRIQVLS